MTLVNHEPGAEHDDIGFAHRVDGVRTRRCARRQQAHGTDAARGRGDRGLAPDASNARRVVRIEAVGLRDEVERNRAHRQHASYRADEFGQSGRARRPDSASAPSGRSAAGCPADARTGRRPRRCGAAGHRPIPGDPDRGPARAASAMRRSPGGNTRSSRRMRPDEPPSSATVTIAVKSVVTSRSADSEACRPCPPPARPPGSDHSRPRSRCTTVARTPSPTTVGELLRHHHRAVLAARATDGQGQVTLALAGVAGADDLQDRRVPIEESPRRPAGRARSRAPRRLAR